MREIKFRAWNGCGMVYSDNLEEFFAAYDKSPRMQFTGLQDKNGKDIYESDRVLDFAGRVWIVDYLEDQACFVFRYEKNKDAYQLFNAFNRSQRPLEIIGNIHE